jgi:altronate hydrolase
MDVNAGKIFDSNATLEEVSGEIYQKILDTASGKQTVSEALGHQEFVITYKTFEPVGPSCLVR